MLQAHFTYNTKKELYDLIEYFEIANICTFYRYVLKLNINPEYGYSPANENFTTDKGYSFYALCEFTESQNKTNKH